MSQQQSNSNVLTIKTVQIAPFRTLMTALKDILLETNITFQADGIRIINMDKSHTILAHLILSSQNFEFYECKKEKIVIFYYNLPFFCFSKISNLGLEIPSCLAVFDLFPFIFCIISIA